MNFIYILNFFIPIIFIAFFGYWLDKTVQPDKERTRKRLQRIK